MQLAVLVLLDGLDHVGIDVLPIAVANVRQLAKQVAVVLGATETNNREHRAVVDAVRDDFAARGIPVYPSVERAAFALGRLAGG